MNDDFSNINLYIKERLKLYYMKCFRKYVDENYFGPNTTYKLVRIKFIETRYEFNDITQTETLKKTLYTLSDRYYRYCVYRRRQFFSNSIWPAVVGGVVSVVFSIITTLVTTLVLIKFGLR